MHTGDHPLGFLAHPDEGTHPGVVMIPDVWGLKDLYRRLATRLATEGFAVLAIDPYRKTGCPELTDPASAMAWIREIPDPVMLETIQDAVDALAADAAVGGGKVGLTGFCMGGMYAILGACGCTGVSAVAPWYGMIRYDDGLVPGAKPRHPIDALDDLACPLLGLYGAEDAIIPTADVEAMQKKLDARGVACATHVYPGAGHAFLNDTRPDAYREEAGRDAWAKLVPFLRSELTP